MINHIDIAEAMIEIANQAMKDLPPDQPITWKTLKESLEKYIIAEEHEIKRLRDFKLNREN